MARCTVQVAAALGTAFIVNTDQFGDRPIADMLRSEGKGSIAPFRDIAARYTLDHCGRLAVIRCAAHEAPRFCHLLRSARSVAAAVRARPARGGC